MCEHVRWLHQSTGIHGTLFVHAARGGVRIVREVSSYRSQWLGAGGSFSPAFRDAASRQEVGSDEGLLKTTSVNFATRKIGVAWGTRSREVVTKCLGPGAGQGGVGGGWQLYGSGARWDLARGKGWEGGVGHAQARTGDLYMVAAAFLHYGCIIPRAYGRARLFMVAGARAYTCARFLIVCILSRSHASKWTLELIIGLVRRGNKAIIVGAVHQ